MNEFKGLSKGTTVIAYSGRRRFGAAAIALSFLLAACAVTHSGDENGISIEYTTYQPGVAQWKADNHCAQYGKRAVLVRRGPRESNYGLIPQTNVAEFDCVK